MAVRRSENRTAYRKVHFETDKASEIGELFREMGEFLASLGEGAVLAHEVTFERDTDADGWPVWWLVAYVYDHAVEA